MRAGTEGLAVHPVPSFPSRCGPLRFVGVQLLILFSVASQLSCGGVNRRQGRLEPAAALALLREDAHGVLTLAEGWTAKLDLIVSDEAWQSSQAFYQALEAIGILRRSVDRPGSRSFSLRTDEDARDITQIEATLILRRPVFSKVTRIDQHGKTARLTVEVTTAGTRTLQRLYPALKSMQKPAGSWAHWWQRLPAPEATTRERTYFLYNHKPDASTNRWGMFDSAAGIEELFSPNGAIREGAARRLGELGEAAVPAVPFLVDRLADHGWGPHGVAGTWGDQQVTWREVVDVAGAARGAIKRVGEPAVDPLLAALAIHAENAARDPKDREVASGVVWLLGEIGDRRAIEPLSGLIQTCPAVSSEACVALRKLQGTRAEGCAE